MINNLKSGSLRRRLLKHVVTASIIVLTLLIIFDAYLAIKKETEKIEQEFSHVEDTILENLSNSVWTLNKPLVEVQINALTALEYIQYVEVYDSNELFAASNTKEPSHDNIITRVYDLNYTIENESVNIGYVMIMGDTSNIYTNIIKNNVIFLILNILLVIALIFLTLSFLNINLFAHIESMSDFMTHSSWDNADENFKLDRKSLDSPDELDNLVNAFNYQKNELITKSRELLLSQDKFYKVFQTNHSAIIIAELESGAFIDVNNSFFSMFGFTHREEIIGKTAIELNIWSDRETRESLKNHLIEHGAIIQRESTFRIHSTNEIRDALVSAVIIDINGLPAVVTTIQDVSETKRYAEELLHSQRRLHNLAKNQEEIRENERIGISREIHDELGQALTGLKIDLSWLKDNLREAEDTQNKINNMINNIDTSVDVVRKISSQLRPPVLDDLGLIAAIEWLTKDFSERTAIIHDLEIKCDDLMLNKNRDTAIFRIYQETLVNIARHSQATKFTTNIELLDEEIILTVLDNGIGITDQQLSSYNSIGIIGMQERSANINAKISIDNHESGGTQVTLVCKI